MKKKVEKKRNKVHLKFLISKVKFKKILGLKIGF